VVVRSAMAARWVGAHAPHYGEHDAAAIPIHTNLCTWSVLIFEDGRVAAGATEYGGQIALRPTVVNWRTRSEDIVEFIRVIRELAAGLR
jgi:hypothetical protein